MHQTIEDSIRLFWGFSQKNVSQNPGQWQISLPWGSSFVALSLNQSQKVLGSHRSTNRNILGKLLDSQPYSTGTLLLPTKTSKQWVHQPSLIIRPMGYISRSHLRALALEVARKLYHVTIMYYSDAHEIELIKLSTNVHMTVTRKGNWLAILSCFAWMASLSQWLVSGGPWFALVELVLFGWLSWFESDEGESTN